MRSSLSSRFLVLLAIAACLACGATTTQAVAEPKRAIAPPADPLVPFAIENEADYARAIREYYTKTEVRIPMRDGTHLFTNYYVPKDRSRTWPILIMRTPYGIAPYGADNDPRPGETRQFRSFAPNPELTRRGYILVHQDVRGRMMSEGTFVDVRPHRANDHDIDETTDAYDTIDWLVKNVPSNSGKVGAWGISYPGFYAAQAAISGHSALVAVSPQAPVTEWFIGDDFHQHGAFMLAPSFDFYESFGRPRPAPTKHASWEHGAERSDVYDFYLGIGPLSNLAKAGAIPFWDDLMSHGARDDFWKARDPRPFYRGVRPAVLTVGGLYDAEDCFGSLETYRSFEKQSPGAKNTIVYGPWRHGGWARSEGDHLGDISFGAKTSLFYREKIETPFFEKYLRGADVPAPAEAWVFETGTNVWRSWASFPPPGARQESIYFHAGNVASGAPPAAGEDANGRDAYPSDPAKPVPYQERPSEEIDENYMVGDQRFAARRPDVLVYETRALDEDVTLAGPLEAKLWVATTGTDADFVVKLVDVHPADTRDPDPNPTGVRMAGYQELVRGEVMRARFRDGWETPKPFTPNEATQVRFAMNDVSHTFRAGHRIMVQVQSSWFPLVDRNPQTFVDIAKATAADYRAATETIFRAPDHASQLAVTVIAGTVPK